MGSEMEAFFNPSSVAVAGASSSSMKLGNVALSNLERFGFKGKVFAIHPRAGEIMGFPSYPSISEVGKPVEVAVGVLPRELILPFVEDCAAAGVRHIIVSAAGFSDDGPEGAALQRRLEEAVKSRDMRMMGPNSVGTISTQSGFVTSIMTLDPVRRGSISIVAQTGLFAGGFARWISSTQLFGLAKVACLGNKADVDEVDIMDYLEGDGQTGVIAVYSEGIARGREFRESASRVSRAKPIVMLKGGRTDLGMKMAMSHTGSLGGEDAVYRGALAQAGVVMVEDIDGVFGCAKALAYCPLPAGPNLGVVSITGAGTVLAADACRRRGIYLPPLREDTLREAHKGVPEWAFLGNPADIWSATLDKGVEDAYRVILSAMAAQDDIHAILVVFTLVPESDIDGAGLLTDIMEAHPGKPVLACFLGASEADRRRWFLSLEGLAVPVYDSIERGTEAAHALISYAGWLKER